MVDALRAHFALVEAVQGFGEARFIKGLKEIIEGADVKCPHSILIERRDKDNGGARFRRQGVKNLKAISTWNLHIEKEQVWLVRRDGGNRLLAVRALRDDLEFRVILQEGANLLPREQFVVNN